VSVVAAPAAPAPAAPAPADPRQSKLRQWIVERVLAELGAPGELRRDESTLTILRERFASVYTSAGVKLAPDQVKQLEIGVLNEIIGFGPIEPLLDDPTITEVMVNGPNHVYIEQKGHVMESPVRFDDEAHVYRVIDRILRPLGRRVDRKWPIADARLPDGSRVNVIIPPSAIDGPTIAIRKFSKKKLTIKVIREQIAAAIDLVVQTARLRDGSRKIVQITEVQGMEGEVVVMQDIFRFVERGTDAEGR
jgi:pilus assembly protein CpaF